MNFLRIAVLMIISIFSETIFSLSLEDIYSDLSKHYPQYNGITYDEPSSNNFLKNDSWLIQTPNLWESSLEQYNQSFEPSPGNTLDSNFYVPTCETQSDCYGTAICKLVNFTLAPKKLCVTAAYDFLEKTYNAMINAHDSVDIVTLALPTSNKKAFKSMFKNAISQLSIKSIETQNTIVVRFLQGFITTIGIENSKTFLADVTKGLDPKNKLIISISDMRSCTLFSGCTKNVGEKDLIYSFSWNHAKSINIDNNILIVGGENFFGTDYLGKNPVNDSNIQIIGSVAEGARKYANILWKFIANNKGLFSNFCSTYSNGKITNRCVTDIANELKNTSHLHFLDSLENSNQVKAMFVSKLNSGVLNNDADQSEIARVYALKNAQHSIKISQQALYFSSTFPPSDYLHPAHTVDGSIIESIASAIYKRGVDVDIITSTLSRDGLTGYSSFVDLNYIYDCLLKTLNTNFHVPTEEGMQLLNEHLGLGYLGYYPKFYSTNSVGRLYRSHNKFWMVDDKIFYFGSHNFYPSNLQEFGLIVESAEQAQYLLTHFWNPMWAHRIKPYTIDYSMF